MKDQLDFVDADIKEYFDPDKSNSHVSSSPLHFTFEPTLMQLCRNMRDLQRSNQFLMDEIKILREYMDNKDWVQDNPK